MLFKSRFHGPIRTGAITTTYRAWRISRVMAGGKYRCGTIGFIQVDAVDRVTLGEIGEKDAGTSGFASLAALKNMLRRSAPRRLTSRSVIYRVRFHYLGLGKADPPVAITRASLDAIETRLDRMDRLSRRGPWTATVLGLIASNPKVAASRLAPRVGRDTRPFKADVRKLKGLGLTRSLAVGYELSALGQALVRRLSKK